MSNPDYLTDVRHDVDLSELAIIPSFQPDVGDLEYFTQGSCHEFAIALHRITGWPMLVCSSPEPYGSDEDGEEIDSVIHVYVVNPETSEAYDVRGIRPSDIETLKNEVEAIYCDEIYSTDTCRSEGEVMYYVDSEDSGDKPLSAFKENDIEVAKEKVLQLFPHLAPSLKM